jgi:fatty-acid peroxygenase
MHLTGLCYRKNILRPPERFHRWNASPFDFIPQGGGDYDTGHRRADEGIMIELMKTAVGLLTTAARYDVPEQDLRIDLSRLPTIPRSRLLISNIRRA